MSKFTCLQLAKIESKMFWKYVPVTSGVTGRVAGGAECLPRDFWPGNFWSPTWKKEERKKWEKGENGEEKKGNCQRGGGKFKMEEEKVGKWVEDLFFFFFFCFYTFENDENLFWGCQNRNFLPGKSISRWEKKIRKNDFAPSEKFSCCAPACHKVYCRRVWSISSPISKFVHGVWIQ